MEGEGRQVAVAAVCINYFHYQLRQQDRYN